MKQIIRDAEAYIQIQGITDGVREEAQIELDKILSIHIGKELSLELVDELRSFINKYPISVNLFTDVELLPVIEKIQVNL